MVQLLEFQLDLAVRDVLRHRAQRHGRSMEEEARLILAQAVASEAAVSTSARGMGSRMVAVFADAALEQPIPEWRKTQGSSVDLRDTLIAAIALTREAQLGTRNMRHFSDTSLSLINPFPQDAAPHGETN